MCGATEYSDRMSIVAFFSILNSFKLLGGGPNTIRHQPAFDKKKSKTTQFNESMMVFTTYLHSILCIINDILCHRLFTPYYGVPMIIYNFL